MLLLNNDDVAKVLDVPTCLAAMETGYQDLVNEDAAYGFRTDFFVPCDRADGYFDFSSMQGAVRSLGVFAIRLKLDILHWPEGQHTEEKYCIQPGTYCGLILLVSIRNGEPLAIIHDGHIQHMRMGGSAGIGTKYLAKDDAHTVGMLGSGGMARSFLPAFCAVRDIVLAKIYSPTRGNREAYAAEMSQSVGIPVEAVDTAEEAVRGAEIVSLCTDAIEPVMNADWLTPGAHVTNVRNEEDPRLHQSADVIIKLGWGVGERALSTPEGRTVGAEIGGVIRVGRPEEQARIRREQRPPRPLYPQLVDLMAGRVTGRTSDQQITFFINEGTQGVQIASVAGRVYQLAREKGLGREIPTDWFTQSIRN